MRSTHNPYPMQRNLKFQAQSLSRLASILALALVMAGAVAAQTTLPSGPFGFVINTTFSNASTQGGAAMLGLMNFDGFGNVSGPYSLELGSGGANQKQSITGNFMGTYSSNPDGTGTISIALDKGVNLTLAMVIDNRGRGLELALTGCVGPICDLSGSVVSGVGAAEFNGIPHPVRQGFLNGSYGLQSVKSSPAPLTSVEVWTFDGAGNVSLSGTFVGPSLSAGSETLLGAYSVNPDGTGTINVPPQQGSLLGQTYVFVITNGHSGLLVLQTNRAGDGVRYAIGRHQ